MAGAAQATIRVFINPLVPFVWWGGILMLLGGILCWWPVRPRAQAKVRAGSEVETDASEQKPVEVADGGVIA
ncbi:hypothetical protein KDK_18810 [Dictyobacter kobayashii]|uniref:Cytochrome c-type biogenesis protein CcmF C-terminal domain-containing protein n=1 Tax=Dictyobacter kobayashii TaxID=2014872 RepID=A0A402AG36_9CHLR|nr:hypothetical protein KDK_18810 [Dictyobacter kobayashii]